jgi:hypothetical protein
VQSLIVMPISRHGFQNGPFQDLSESMATNRIKFENFFRRLATWSRDRPIIVSFVIPKTKDYGATDVSANQIDFQDNIYRLFITRSRPTRFSLIFLLFVFVAKCIVIVSIIVG